MTPAGIESATFRFVAQHLNHCATAVPSRTRRVVIALFFLLPTSLSNFNVPGNGNVKIFVYFVLGTSDCSYLYCHLNNL